METMTTTHKPQKPQPPPGSFGERLKAELYRAHMKQADLCRATGITPSVLSRYSTGERTPSWPEVERIAKALGVSVRALSSEVVTQMAQPSDEPLPEGLARYLATREDRIAPVVVRHLKASHFHTDPGIVLDDTFWDEQRELWERRLGLPRMVDAGSPGASGGKPPTQS